MHEPKSETLAFLTLVPREDGSPGVAAEAPDRYTILGPIGVGGMGEVYRVRDSRLGRDLAMKVIRRDLMNNASIVARFVEEAQATAQLEHPGVVPVHDFGTLPDGRLFFTMKEVKGQTLTTVLDEWPRQRLIEAFQRVCEAVAHAHDRGVIHRDLKPDNIMVGAYGEVLVLDWGLAKITGRANPDLPEPDAVRTERSEAVSFQTRIGTVAGTPAYMSPEQARGETDKLDPRSDTYSLGAILYELLSGHPPFTGATVTEVLAAARRGEHAPLDSRIPEDLRTICDRAIAVAPEDRYANAGALASAIQIWQDGAGKRERALALVAEARAAIPEATRMRVEAHTLRDEGTRLLQDVKAWEPIERKRHAWELQDQAAVKEADAELAETRAIRLLQGALTHAPELEEAHDGLADLYRAHHEAAVAKQDLPSERRYLALLQAHDLSGRHAAYLSGTGTLHLDAEPPAEVTLYRFQPTDRRLVPTLVGPLGRTPLRDVPISMGSYLCVLKAPGCDEVRYPMVIGRGQAWNAPDASPPPVWMPPEGELDRDDVYVPGGWFVTQDDPSAPDARAAERLWLDDFVIRRHPVTNTEYLAFLNDLVARGELEAALRWAPRERSGHANAAGAMIYGQDAEGRFQLVPDSDGDLWKPNWPVFYVDLPSARAFAAWVAERTGFAWRLPSEAERDKAARGADGRVYPWGNFLDPTWACVRESHHRRPMPAAVTAWPADESPYGVRGLAGNMCDWTECWPDPEADRGVLRGGAWSHTSAASKIGFTPAIRRLAATWRSETTSFRIARDAGPRVRRKRIRLTTDPTQR